MTSIIIGILIIYAVFVLGLGVFANMKGKDTSEDYFIHSRSVSWFHLGITFIATWYSTFGFIAGPGKMFADGITAYLSFGAFNIMSAFFLWFLGRRFWQLGKQNGYITPGDLLGDHYRSQSIKIMTGLIGILGLFPYILVQLVAIGKVIDVATAGTISYENAVLLAGFIATFYVVSGGIRAVIWTDILQAILFSAVAIFGLCAVISAVGDLGSGFDISIEKKPEAFTISKTEFGKPLTFLITWAFAGILLPHLWQRAYMAKSADVIGKTVLVHATFTFFYMAILVFTALLGIGLLDGVTDSDKFIPTLYAELIPWALPVLVLATFAAGMSTVDSQLLTVSSVFIRDVISPIIGKTFDPAKEKLMGRGIILFAILILIFLALTPESQGAIIAVASKGIGLAFMLLVPVIGALFWSGATRMAALSALIAGVVIQMVFEFGLIDASIIPYAFGSPIVAFIFQCLIFFSLSLLAKTHAPERQS